MEKKEEKSSKEKNEQLFVQKKISKIPNQEILGGIRSAIARGSNLRDAMMSFYQAGYDKTEIEEAAKVYVELQKSPEEIVKKDENKENKKQSIKKIISKEEKTNNKLEESKKEAKQKETKIKKKETPKVIQRVSNYDLPKKPKPPKGKAVTIILIFLLLFLLGALAAVILFKDELVRFFNSFFS
jgi:uncharacterized membrane protein